MGYDVVLKPFALVSQIHSAEVAGNLARSQKFTSASPTSVFESVILKNDEPSECYEINHNDVWPHQVEHILLALQVVHQSRHQQEGQARAAHQVPLMSHVLRIGIVNGPCILFPSEALVLVYHTEVAEKCAEYQHDRVVNWGYLPRNHLVNFPVKLVLQSHQLFLLSVVLQTFLKIHFLSI